jgi:hypothetical protein
MRHNLCKKNQGSIFFLIKKEKNLYEKVGKFISKNRKARMQTNNKFRETLERYIGYRGIDIVLHMKDGQVIELDKNRVMEGEFVIGNLEMGPIKIAIQEIKKADFYAA